MSQLSKQSDSSFFSHINNWTQCSLVFKLWQWPSVTLEINNTHKRGWPRMKERKNRVYVCVSGGWVYQKHKTDLLVQCITVALQCAFCLRSNLCLHQSFLHALCLNSDGMSIPAWLHAILVCMDYRWSLWGLLLKLQEHSNIFILFIYFFVKWLWWYMTKKMTFRWLPLGIELLEHNTSSFKTLKWGL